MIFLTLKIFNVLYIHYLCFTFFTLQKIQVSNKKVTNVMNFELLATIEAKQFNVDLS